VAKSFTIQEGQPNYKVRRVGISRELEKKVVYVGLRRDAYLNRKLQPDKKNQKKSSPL